jgi:hypothetical protein
MKNGKCKMRNAKWPSLRSELREFPPPQAFEVELLFSRIELDLLDNPAHPRLLRQNSFAYPIALLIGPR